MKKFTQLRRTATTPLKRKLLHQSILKEIASFKSSSLKTEQKTQNKHKAKNHIHQRNQRSQR